MIPRSLALRILRASSTTTSHNTALRCLTTITRPSPSRLHLRSASHLPPSHPLNLRYQSQSISKSPADEKIEEITELFQTAKDEFEIAMEETEKMTVYAEEDRKAAREELEKVQEAYRSVVEGSDEGLANEVKGRIGQRIRELEMGVKRMEEMVLEQD